MGRARRKLAVDRTKRALIRSMRQKRWHNGKLADYFNCSLRTIYRVISNYYEDDLDEDKAYVDGEVGEVTKVEESLYDEEAWPRPMTNQGPEETQSDEMEDIELMMDGPGTFPRSSPRHLEIGSSTYTSRGSVRSHKNYRPEAATSSDRPELPQVPSDEFVVSPSQLRKYRRPTMSAVLPMSKRNVRRRSAIHSRWSRTEVLNSEEPLAKTVGGLSRPHSRVDHTERLRPSTATSSETGQFGYGRAGAVSEGKAAVQAFLASIQPHSPLTLHTSKLVELGIITRQHIEALSLMLEASLDELRDKLWSCGVSTIDYILIRDALLSIRKELNPNPSQGAYGAVTPSSMVVFLECLHPPLGHHAGIFEDSGIGAMHLMKLGSIDWESCGLNRELSKRGLNFMDILMVRDACRRRLVDSEA